MTTILKFKRKSGEYKYTQTNLEWTTRQGIYYIHYPFLIYKDMMSLEYKLTHISSGAQICSTSYLYGAKYIASRLLPLPQWLLPTKSLVSHMSQEQRLFCTDIITRYRSETKDRISKLDKKCPFTI
jgi:hypothetical protein